MADLIVMNDKNGPSYADSLKNMTTNMCLDTVSISRYFDLFKTKDLVNRELCSFIAWKQKDQHEEFRLPTAIFEGLQQNTTLFGYGFMQLLEI